MGIPFRILKAYSCVLEDSLAVDDAGLAAVLRLYVFNDIVFDLDAASDEVRLGLDGIVCHTHTQPNQIPTGARSNSGRC